MDREAVLSQTRHVKALAASAAEIVINAVYDAAERKRARRSLTEDTLTFEETPGSEGRDFTIKVTSSTGQVWKLSMQEGVHGRIFAIRQERPDGGSEILCSGGWSLGGGAKPRFGVTQFKHSPQNFADLTRMAEAMAGSAGELPKRPVWPSDPTARVLEADGWMPGKNARALYRKLYEDQTRRVFEWAGPLFETTARMFADEGLTWGAEALTWTYRHDGRFPEPGGTVNTACLLPREGRSTVAAVFRKAQPNLETQTFIVWKEKQDGGGRGPIHLMPIADMAMDDIEAFIEGGGVPAISYFPSSGEVRVTERAMASDVLSCFAEQLGEARAVLTDMPLYALPGSRPVMTADFSCFDRIESWTRAGRAAAAKSILETAPETVTLPHLSP